MNQEIDKVRSFITEGGSICPFAKHCTIHYVLDTEDFKSSLSKFSSDEAIVVVSSNPDSLIDFDKTKSWARITFLKAMRYVAKLTYPDVAEIALNKEIYLNIYPILFDDGAKIQPNIAFKDKVIITICMAPVYPVTHPRYCPIPILVLTWYEDLQKAGIFPKVRQAMVKEHGFVYDALDLMLPLPKDK